MSYFAAAATRGADGWSGSEVSLASVSDLEDVTDRLRDVDPDADVSLLFVEADETYLVILRLDEGEDLRAFGSDIAFAEESRLGALLLGEVEEPALDLDHDPEEQVQDRDSLPPGDAEPVGDAEILADLGVPGSRLRALCAQDGLLPGDITAEVCQVIGCGDEIEELREA